MLKPLPAPFIGESFRSVVVSSLSGLLVVSFPSVDAIAPVSSALHEIVDAPPKTRLTKFPPSANAVVRKRSSRQTVNGHMCHPTDQ